MRVQRVLMRGSGFESWTLLGDDHRAVEPVERFLAYLASVEKSPNTIKAYAHDLKDWLTYLGGRGLDWRCATLEDVAGFVAWLRLAPAVRDGKVAVLPTVEHHCSASSVNRKLGCSQGKPKSRHELAIPIVSAGESLGMSIVVCTVIGREQVRLSWSHCVASAFRSKHLTRTALDIITVTGRPHPRSPA
ncbi:MAG TPA: site-specific integrase [Pseudonocardiaceae bacterium]|jgi:hypothetical protein|nr:site-specific integrase [Pseudonocardiaceae bacterium]